MTAKNRTDMAKTILPDVVTDYLFGLARQNPGAALQVFRLTPDTLGGRDIQNVEHMNCRTGAVEYHRIFGFEPVRATVGVRFYGVGDAMFLIGDAADWNMRKEVGVCPCLQYPCSII